MKETNNSRRSFLKTSSTVLGVMFTASAFSSVFTACEQNESLPTSNGGLSLIIDLNTEAKLQTIGSVVKKYSPDYEGGFAGIIIIRQSETEFLVLKAVCTHDSGSINIPVAGSQVMVCGLHSAEFSVLDGSNTKAPSSTGKKVSNLKKFNYEFSPATQILTIFLT